MATTTKDIYLKMNVDTKDFNDSITGMKKELSRLKGLVGNSILSPEEQRAALTRMAELKDGIQDISKATSNVEGFEVLNRGVGALSAGMAASAGALKLFGIENEKLNKTMEIAQTVMAASLSIQQLKDLAQLKSVAITTAQSVATGVATAAQWAWNAAMSANPIGAVVVAVAALTAGIVLLTKWLKRSKDTTEEDAEAKKRLKEATQDLADASEEASRRVMESDMNIDQLEKDLQKAKNDRIDADKAADKAYAKSKEDIAANEKMNDDERIKAEQEATLLYNKWKKDNETIYNNEVAAIKKSDADKKKKEQDKIYNDELNRKKQHQKDLKDAEINFQNDLQDFINNFEEDVIDDDIDIPEYNPNTDPQTKRTKERLIYESDLYWEQKQKTEEGNQLAYDMGIISYKQYMDNKDAITQASIEKEKKQRDEAFMMAEAGVRALSEVSNAVFAIQMAKQEQLLKNGSITQEQFDKKKKELEKKASRRAKAIAISETVINTAKAIMAMQGAGFPVGLVMSALAAVTGAASIAKIVAQPDDPGSGGGGGGGGGGGSSSSGSLPSAGTAPSTSFSFTPQTKTPEIAPTKSYVVSKDVENQQQLDRQIMANGTT